MNFLNSYNQGFLGNEPIDAEEVIQKDEFDKEKLNFLNNNKKSNLSKFSYLLNIETNEYKKFTSNDNVIINISKTYPLDTEYEIDIFHSEPLLSWLLDRNMDYMQERVLKTFKTKQEGLKISQMFPVFFFYTERQTCPSCENIIQKKASGKYVPFIAFHSDYPPDFVLLSGSKLPLQSKNFTPAYSIPPRKAELAFLLLQKLKDVREPIDLHLEPFRIDYNNIFYNVFSFMKKREESNQNKINLIENKIDSLKNIQQQCKENFKNLPKGNDENNLLYNAISLNNQFQNIMLDLMEKQIEEEKNLKSSTKKFFETQEEKLESEEIIFIEFKNNFQRVPIQYKI